MKAKKKIARVFMVFTLLLIFSSVIKDNVKAEEAYSVVAGGNSMGGATSISLGKTYATSLVGEEKLYFKFTTPAQKGYFDFYSKNVNVETDWRQLKVRLINDISEVQSECSYGGYNAEQSHNIILKPSTTYFIEVYNNAPSDVPGNIKFSIKYTADKGGDEMSNALYINLSEKVVGSMDGSEDVDFYKFNSNNYSKYKFYTKNINIDPIWYGLHIILYNEIGEELYNSELGQGKEAEEIVSLSPNSVYYVKVYGNENNGNYTFKISPVKKNISDAIISNIKKKTYTGKNITPSVKIIYGSNTLVKNKDYKVTYSKNKNPGKATVKFTGIGDYEGTVSKTFIIKPPKMTLKSIKNTKGMKAKVSWIKAVGVSGYQIKYASNSKFSDSKSIKIKKSVSSKTIKNLIKRKKYYFKIRAYKKIDGKNAYGKWSDVKKIRIKK